MSRRALYRYGIALTEIELIGIEVISLAGILKLYFDHIGATERLGDVTQPVVGAHLRSLTTATSAGAHGTASHVGRRRLVIHISLAVTPSTGGVVYLVQGGNESFPTPYGG